MDSFIGYCDSIIAASPARRGALSQDVCRQGIGTLGAAGVPPSLLGKPPGVRLRLFSLGAAAG